MNPKSVVSIICLANSRKMSGRCVAGRKIENGKIGEWIRPVSARPTEEISEEDRRYKDGILPALLDVISIPMIGAKPHNFQTENHLIDDRFHWDKVRTATKDEVKASVENPKGPLWDNSDSSGSGQHDRVPVTIANSLKHSLVLIEVQDLRIHVAIEGAKFGNAKKKARGEFTYDGIPYVLAITDPRIEAEYFKQAEATYSIGKAILCVSLGEPFGGYAYKLIAAVIK